jgi:hypothetical protein
MWIMSNGTEEQRKQLEILRSLEYANKSIAESQGEQAKKAMMSRANQAKLVQLQNTWNQLVFQMVDVFIPLLNVLMQVSIVVLRIATPFIKAAGAVWGIWKVFSLVFNVVKNIFPAFARWLGPIGLVWAAVDSIYNIIKRWMGLWKDFQSGAISGWELIGKGLWAVAQGIFDAIVDPFKKAFEWLQGIFLGRSPSKIGLMMVAGIKAVGRMIFDNLMNPFKLAWAAIKKLFGGSLATTPVDVATNQGQSVRPVITSASAETVAKAEENKMAATEKLLTAIANSINGLRSDLTSGKVATNIDSQLVSTVSYRQTLFRKGYGTNQAVA